MKFWIIYDSKEEKAFFWVLKTEKGIALAKSCKGYSTRRSAKTAIENIKDKIAWADIQSAPKGDTPAWAG